MQASSEPIFPVLDITTPADECASESVVPPFEPLIASSEVSSYHSPIPPPSTSPLPVVQYQVPVASPRRSGRQSRLPLWLQNFVTKPKTNTCLYPPEDHLT